MRPSLLALVLGSIVVAASFVSPAVSLAHAEPERANPPINGVVATAPTVVEIWFDEEVSSEGTTIQVIGPGGIQVDLGDAAVDLFDPERKRVTVSVRPNLEPGSYTVQWRSMSGADGDDARGGYVFQIGSATPVASPVVVATGSPVPPTQVAASGANETPVPGARPVADPNDFDEQGFGLAVGAGALVAVLIFAFWRRVRPATSDLPD